MRAGLQFPRLALLRAAGFAAALGFLIYGILSGEPQIVLRKATNVCLECIGVG